MTEGGSLLAEQPAAGLRDQSLDFLRGLAALSIIFIHTAFWSGEAYVPQAVEALSLILDVPFFFFLSGWGGGYARSSCVCMWPCCWSSGRRWARPRG